MITMNIQEKPRVKNLSKSQSTPSLVTFPRPLFQGFSWRPRDPRVSTPLPGQLGWRSFRPGDEQPQAEGLGVGPLPGAELGGHDAQHRDAETWGL